MNTMPPEEGREGSQADAQVPEAEDRPEPEIVNEESPDEPTEESVLDENGQDAEPESEAETETDTEPDTPESEESASSGKAAHVTPLLRRQVEALLFVAEQPVTPHRIAKVLKVAEGLVRAAIRDLAADYDQQNRAFGVTEIAGGYQVLSRPEYGNLVSKLYEQGRQTRLSPAALETLAIVAYKQPVMRVAVEDIRGVGVQPMLRNLLDMGLLRVVGRAEALGRPLLYGTTKKFLVTFGLKSPKDLPSVEDLKAVD